MVERPLRTRLTPTLIGPCRAEAVSDRPLCTEPGPEPNATWDLLWTKWHWDRFFSEYFGISAVCMITPIFHNRISDEAVCLVLSYIFSNKAFGLAVTGTGTENKEVV